MFLRHICLARSCSLPVTFPLTEEAWSHHGGVITLLSAREVAGTKAAGKDILIKQSSRNDVGLWRGDGYLLSSPPLKYHPPL